MTNDQSHHTTTLLNHISTLQRVQQLFTVSTIQLYNTSFLHYCITHTYLTTWHGNWSKSAEYFITTPYYIYLRIWYENWLNSTQYYISASQCYFTILQSLEHRLWQLIKVTTILHYNITITWA